MKRLAIALSACLLGAAVAATGPRADGPSVCTLIGCESGIAIEIRKASDAVKRARFCVRGRCKRIAVKRDNRTYERIRVECSEEITVLGVLTTRDARGRRLGRYKALIPLRRTQPNGPDCPPTCFQAGVRFNGARLVVLPSPG